ncbi:MAG: DUF2141 domain-containing protein [Caulobacteraceae bacterium]|nr:DUF2141 domain-containing protein [Caulobacteraceae bacterium]
MPFKARALAAALMILCCGGAVGAAAETLNCQGAPSSARLIVTVEDVPSSRGFVVGVLFGPDHARYLVDHQELLHWREPAQAGSTTLCHTVAPGAYELVVYQDANANGRIDKDIFGRPREPYGFSNNIRPLLHRPSLQSTRFTAGPGDTLLHIRLLPP